MTVVFPAPLVPSRAVIWPLWKVRVRSWTAALWGWYSLVTDTRVTPRGPPSSVPFPFCGDDPAREMQTQQEASRVPRYCSRLVFQGTACMNSGCETHETIRKSLSTKIKRQVTYWQELSESSDCKVLYLMSSIV